jgi:hypothetical protein
LKIEKAEKRILSFHSLNVGEAHAASSVALTMPHCTRKIYTQ